MKDVGDKATPGPWFCDWGNWEVETRHEDYFRFTICPLCPDSRTSECYRDNQLAQEDPENYGYLKENYPENEIKNVSKHRWNGPIDGEFIATARNNWNKILEMNRVLLEAVEFYYSNSGLMQRHPALRAVEKCREIVGGK